MHSAEAISVLLPGTDASIRPTTVRPSAGRLLACLLATAASGFGTQAQAQVSVSSAGTVVSNTATLSFDMDGAGRTVSSNTVRIILAERLDVTVVADAPTAIVTGGDEQAVAFRVSNGGNGAETFELAGGASGDGASVITLAADVDGDGAYDPKTDRKLPDAQIALGAGQGAVVFVIVGGARGGTVVSLAAKSATGTGAPGTEFAGKGDGGGDAVVGSTGAAASASTTFAAGPAEPTLTKSQTVLAPDGSARAVKGAVVTYTLDARFPGAAQGIRIEDPIPAGAAYVAGSLMFDGAALSDTDDTDAGRFDGRSVAVALGDILGAATRSIRFQVTIQ